MRFFKFILDALRVISLLLIIVGFVSSVGKWDFSWLWLSLISFIVFVVLAQIKISPKKGMQSGKVVDLKPAESFSKITERKLTNGITQGLNSTRLRNKRGQFAKKK